MWHSGSGSCSAGKGCAFQCELPISPHCLLFRKVLSVALIVIGLEVACIFRIAMIQLVLFFPLLLLLSGDGALCSFLGSCYKQMGKISIPGDSLGGFPTLWVSPIEDSSIAALKLGVGMATFSSQLPRGDSMNF